MAILTTTANALSSWEVVSAFEDRLKLVLGDAGKPNGFVKITGEPDGKEGGAYRSEDGIHLVVGQPEPEVNDGAARYGQRVRRVFQLHLVTKNAEDRAGEDRIALRKHLALEDIVFNGMSQTPPYVAGSGGVSWNTPVGVTLKWIPGGDVIRRAKKIDGSRFVSVHLFEVIYVQKMQVIA